MVNYVPHIFPICAGVVVGCEDVLCDFLAYVVGISLFVDILLCFLYGNFEYFEVSF